MNQGPGQMLFFQTPRSALRRLVAPLAGRVSYRALQRSMSNHSVIDLCSSRSRFRAIAIILAALALHCGGCSAPAPSAKFVEQAERLHAGALASAVSSNPDLNDYVQFIGSRLAAAAHEAVPNRANEELLQALRCHLVDCPLINAFYTGGHHIYVYSGLLAACENEDELAAAIAHEYAHAIDLAVEKTKLRPDPNQQLPLVAWQFVVNRFSLDQEMSADDLAFQIYTRCGWDPLRFSALFARLATAAPYPPAPDRPAPSSRAFRFRGQAADAQRSWRKPPVADPKTYDSLRRAGETQSATNSEAELFLRAFPNCMLGGDPPETIEAQQKLRPPPPPQPKLEPS